MDEEDINQYGFDVTEELSRILSEELTSSIDKQIINDLIFMRYQTKYESLIRENKINSILGVDLIDIMKELNISYKIFKRLEEDYYKLG